MMLIPSILVINLFLFSPSPSTSEEINSNYLNCPCPLKTPNLVRYSRETYVNETLKGECIENAMKEEADMFLTITCRANRTYTMRGKCVCKPGYFLRRIPQVNASDRSKRSVDDSIRDSGEDDEIDEVYRSRPKRSPRRGGSRSRSRLRRSRTIRITASSGCSIKPRPELRCIHHGSYTGPGCDKTGSSVCPCRKKYFRLPEDRNTPGTDCYGVGKIKKIYYSNHTDGSVDLAWRSSFTIAGYTPIFLVSLNDGKYKRQTQAYMRFPRSNETKTYKVQVITEVRIANETHQGEPQFRYITVYKERYRSMACRLERNYVLQATTLVAFGLFSYYFYM